MVSHINMTQLCDKSVAPLDIWWCLLVTNCERFHANVTLSFIKIGTQKRLLCQGRYMTPWCPITHIEHHQTPLNHLDIMVGSRFEWRHHATKTVFLALLHWGQKSGLKCNPNFEARCVSHRCLGYPILRLSQALMKALLSVWDWMLHIWVSARPGVSLSCLPTVTP